MALSSAFITVHSVHGTEYFSGTVQLEETFKIGRESKKLDEWVIVKVYDIHGGNLMQNFNQIPDCMFKAFFYQ